MTDNAFMLGILQERPGEWVSQADIIAWSISKRGFGLTVHSRAADLRKPEHGGHTVENKVEKRNGRAVSYYRLLPSLEAVAPPDVVPSRGLADGAAASSEEAADRGDQDSPSLFPIPASARTKEPAWS